MRNPIFNTTHFVRVQVRRRKPKDESLRVTETKDDLRRANLKMFKPRGILCAIPSSSRRREPKDQSLRETVTQVGIVPERSEWY